MGGTSGIAYHRQAEEIVSQSVSVGLDFDQVCVQMPVQSASVDENLYEGSSLFQFEVATGVFVVIAARWGSHAERKLRQAVAMFSQGEQGNG